MVSLNEKLKARLGKVKDINPKEEMAVKHILNEPVPPTIEPNVKVDINFDYIDETEKSDGVPEKIPVSKEEIIPLYESIGKIRGKIETMKEEQETIDVMLSAMQKTSEEFKVKREVLLEEIFQLQKRIFDLLRE